MSKTTIKIFDEEKITNKGLSPDVKVLLDKASESGIEIKVEINLKRHNFDHDANVFFQAYNKRGSGLKPWPMGNIKDLNSSEINTFKYFVPDIEKNDASFNLFVSKTGTFNKINVNRVIGKSKIREFYDEPDDGSDDDYKTESLLPTREDDIGTAFKIEMVPGRKPVLILRKGCNIKHKLDNNIDPIQKTLIYTAALRELLKTYLSDNRYEDCPWKIKWFEEVENKFGGSDYNTPDSLFISLDNDEREINPDAENWIEDAAGIFVSNLIDAEGKKLIDKFALKNNSVGISDIEDSEL
jgi:hypothetical protein